MNERKMEKESEVYYKIKRANNLVVFMLENE